MSDVRVIYSAGIGQFYENDLQTGKRVLETIDRLKAGVLPVSLIESDGLASENDLEMVHHPAYIRYIRDISRGGGGYIGFDDESVLGGSGFHAACKAAGVSMEAVDCIFNGADSAYALSVPPGHHAGVTYGGGFCVFNNIALAAVHARRGGIKKILIVDWDCHFGNGTYEIFRNDPDLYMISLHEYPLEDMHLSSVDHVLGTFTNKRVVSFSFPPLTTNRTYLMVLEELLERAAKNFAPELIMISAGQDGHFLDPMGTLSLNSHAYQEAASLVRKCARRFTSGKFTTHLEGGYGSGFTDSNLAVISGMSGRDIDLPNESGTGAEREYTQLALRMHGTEDIEKKLQRVLDSMGTMQMY